MVKSEYRLHDQVREVPVKVMVNGSYTEDTEWDETLWVERGAIIEITPELENKRIRIIDRELFLRSEIIE